MISDAIEDRAAFCRSSDPAFASWAEGYGVIQHSPLTQARVHALAEMLAGRGVRGDGVPLYDILHAADRIASAAMWVVVHQTYANRVYLDGRRSKAAVCFARRAESGDFAFDQA